SGAQFVDAFSLLMRPTSQSSCRFTSCSYPPCCGKSRQCVLLFDVSRGLFRCAGRCWWRLRPFSDATLEVLQILPHLLQRKPKGEKSLRDIAGPAADQTLAAQRRDFGRIELQRRIDW